MNFLDDLKNESTTVGEGQKTFTPHKSGVALGEITGFWLIPSTDATKKTVQMKWELKYEDGSKVQSDFETIKNTDGANNKIGWTNLSNILAVVGVQLKDIQFSGEKQFGKDVQKATTLIGKKLYTAVQVRKDETKTNGKTYDAFQIMDVFSPESRKTAVEMKDGKEAVKIDSFSDLVDIEGEHFKAKGETKEEESADENINDMFKQG